MALGKFGVVSRAAGHFVPILLGSGCNPPDTAVVVDNDYPASATDPIVVYQAYWQAVAFTTPIPPGSSSRPQETVPASANTAYALLAPGWQPTDSTTPTSLVVLQSQVGFSVHLDHTLHIPVSDATFAGNCTAGSTLTQAQADFITQRVFPGVFACLTYDAATCNVTPVTDDGCQDAGETGQGGGAVGDGGEANGNGAAAASDGIGGSGDGTAASDGDGTAPSDGDATATSDGGATPGSDGGAP